MSIRVYMNQGQKLASPLDHSHTGVDIPTTVSLYSNKGGAVEWFESLWPGIFQSFSANCSNTETQPIYCQSEGEIEKWLARHVQQKHAFQHWFQKVLQPVEALTLWRYLLPSILFFQLDPVRSWLFDPGLPYRPKGCFSLLVIISTGGESISVILQ